MAASWPRCTPPTGTWVRLLLISAARDALVTSVTTAAGANRRLSYSLVDSPPVFSVNAQSGLVRLERPLDREVCDRFNLTLQAQDHGQPPLATRVPLTVLVQDVNDSPPEFTQQVYAVAVSEAAPLGSPIDAGLRAVSRDAGVNAQITYSLVAGNERGHFSIEPSTGARQQPPLPYRTTRFMRAAVIALQTSMCSIITAICNTP